MSFIYRNIRQAGGKGTITKVTKVGNHTFMMYIQLNEKKKKPK